MFQRRHSASFTNTSDMWVVLSSRPSGSTEGELQGFARLTSHLDETGSRLPGSLLLASWVYAPVPAFSLAAAQGLESISHTVQ